MSIARVARLGDSQKRRKHEYGGGRITYGALALNALVTIYLFASVPVASFARTGWTLDECRRRWDREIDSHQTMLLSI
jgi:hypothetical protein